MIYAGLFSHSCQLLYSPAGYWIVHCLLCSGMIVLVLRDLHLASVIPDNKKMTNYPSLPIGWRWKWVRGLWELCGWKHRHRIVRHLRRGCWRERESVTLCNRIVTQLPDHICPTLLMVAAKNCELVYFCARIRNYYASEIHGLDSYGGGSFVRCFQEHLHEDIWWNSVSFTLTMKESDLKQIHELRLAVWLGQK